MPTDYKYERQSPGDFYLGLSAMIASFHGSGISVGILLIFNNFSHSAAIPDDVAFLERINTAPGTCRGCRKQFAFIWREQKYGFSALPQGYVSPRAPCPNPGSNITRAFDTLAGYMEPLASPNRRNIQWTTGVLKQTIHSTTKEVFSFGSAAAVKSECLAMEHQGTMSAFQFVGGIAALFGREQAVVALAWRRRWFVLRRGRMSGNPDVLEYYRSKHSSKPIRAIDLSECAVWKHVGPGFVRKEFQNNFVFIVKTTSRTFYLVAKTEVEMLVWVYSISQVCNLGQLEDGADSMESFSRMPCSLQPSPASSLPTSLPRDDLSTNSVAAEESRSESEFLSLPDYLILSNCETGRPRHTSLPTRCDSWSNSDRSLEQTSFDDVFVDCLQPVPPSNLAHPSRHGSGSQKAPSLRPQAALIWSRDINGPTRDHCSSPLPETSLNSTIQVDKNQGSLPYEAKELDIMCNMPPPRPPKPSHLSERRPEKQLKKPECTMAPRRISLSGLDNMRTWK
ncbi:GRB2-associated-binding protein 3, partial [Leptonychotes weddellii]|uniref:GRB2-associated-binding protein 3 n=1 Tax=Leptonychotes weddellii TaxID=9713 RepID=A0A2U3XZT7_LEPWE